MATKCIDHIPASHCDRSRRQPHATRGSRSGRYVGAKIEGGVRREGGH
jgi:hypothetical protein